MDPAILGWFITQKAGMMFEVIARQFDDRGGGLARVNGKPRLVEGLALPSEEVEAAFLTTTAPPRGSRSISCWRIFTYPLRPWESGKSRGCVRALAARMPAYITLKDVKKRWGKGQEDIFPVAQFEKLWGDMTALTDLLAASPWCRETEGSS